MTGSAATVVYVLGIVLVALNILLDVYLSFLPYAVLLVGSVLLFPGWLARG